MFQKAWNPWTHLSFIARLVVTASVALIVASVVMLVTVAYEETEQVEANLDHVMLDQLAILPTTLADWIVVGDFAVIQESLNRFSSQHEVASITYRSANGASVTSKGQLMELQAPAWFAAKFGKLNPVGRTSVKIGGREYGTLKVVLTAHQAINQAWSRLQRHMAILALAVGLDFFGHPVCLAKWIAPALGAESRCPSLGSG